MPAWTERLGDVDARPFRLDVFGTGTAFSEAVIVCDRQIAIIEGADFAAKGIPPVAVSCYVIVNTQTVWQNGQVVGGEEQVYASYRGGFPALGLEEIGIQVNADSAVYLSLSIWGTLLDKVAAGSWCSL